LLILLGNVSKFFLKSGSIWRDHPSLAKHELSIEKCVPFWRTSGMAERHPNCKLLQQNKTKQGKKFHGKQL